MTNRELRSVGHCEPAAGDMDRSLPGPAYRLKIPHADANLTRRRARNGGQAEYASVRVALHRRDGPSAHFFRGALIGLAILMAIWFFTG
jgi:hypothetical protein